MELDYIILFVLINSIIFKQIIVQIKITIILYIKIRINCEKYFAVDSDPYFTKTFTLFFYNSLLCLLYNRLNVCKISVKKSILFIRHLFVCQNFFRKPTPILYIHKTISLPTKIQIPFTRNTFVLKSRLLWQNLAMDPLTTNNTGPAYKRRSPLNIQYLYKLRYERSVRNDS